jgi:hypothetical protein
MFGFGFFNAGPSANTYFSRDSDDYQRVKNNFEVFEKKDGLDSTVHAVFSGKSCFDKKEIPIFLEFFKNEYHHKVKEYTPIFYKYAIQSNDCLEVLRRLIKLGYSVDQKDKNGKTPLYLATKIQQPYIKDVIRLLVENGADINTRNTNSEGKTALISAVTAFCKENNKVSCSSIIHGNLEAVEVLLELRARTDLKDRSGQTALDHVKEIIRNNPTHPFAKKILALLDPNLAEEDAKNQREQDAQQARQQRAQAEARFNSSTQEQARRAAEEQARRAAEEQARRAAEEQARRAAEQARRVSASNETNTIKSAVLKNLDSLKIVATDARSEKLASAVLANIDSLKRKISRICDALVNHQTDSASSPLKQLTIDYITQNLQSDVQTFVENTNKSTPQQKVNQIDMFSYTLKDKVDKNDLVALGLERARS